MKAVVRASAGKRVEPVAMPLVVEHLHFRGAVVHPLLALHGEV
jgi:hypothetical protein